MFWFITNFDLLLIMYVYKKVSWISTHFTFNLCWVSAWKNVRFYLGDLFNTEGNLILSAVDQINFSHRTCQVVRTLYSLTLKSYLAVKKSEEFTIGSFAEKSESEN